MRATPHAEEILAFYVGLIEIQELVAGQAPVELWSTLVRSAEGDFPRLSIERLPIDELLPRFDDFLTRVVDVGTDVIAEGGRALLAVDVSDRTSVLRAALEHDEDEQAETGFCARAFLEALVTSLAATGARDMSSSSERRCFECGAPPGVAVLRDLPDALGSRSLVCSLCATEWRFTRLTCPHCGESDADQLLVHTAESVAHVRVDECRTCERYHKTVDLRVQGNASPVVDELATVELDLWARDRGLTKIRANVLGL